MMILLYILIFALVITVAYLVDLVLTANQLLSNILTMIGVGSQELPDNPVPVVESIIVFLLTAVVVMVIIHVIRAIRRGGD